MLDTAEAAQEARRAAMKARLDEAGVATVSELSPHYGKAVDFDGVPGTIAVVHDAEDRFAADLTDGRRPWGKTSLLVPTSGGAFTYTTPEGA